jgi:hypothetical protein
MASLSTLFVGQPTLLLKGGIMRKVVLLVTLLALGSGSYQPASAENGFLGGGVYNISFWTLPTVRLGFEDKFLFDLGLTFSTEKLQNFTVAFGGVGRFMEVDDDVFLHGGMVFGIADIQDNTAFQFGFILGAEGFVNDAFSVTADVAPVQISANGETEAQFLRGFFGANVYFR